MKIRLLLRRLSYRRSIERKLLLDLMTPPPDVGGYKPRSMNGLYWENWHDKRKEYGV